MALFNIPNLVFATVISRPSKTVKSPYVADIKILDETYAEKHGFDINTLYLCHTPSLGCGGLIEKDKQIMVIANNNPKSQTKFICCLGLYEEFNKSRSILIGVHPNYAEKIVEQCLLTDKLNLIRVNKKKLDTQYTIEQSRFDFHGFTEENTEFILEVKTVPIAKYIDDYDKNTLKIDTTDMLFDNKIALFPVGFQKKKYDVVSERALKHLNHLESIKLNNPKIRTIITYVIQRTDVSSFQASIIDPTYKETLKRVFNNGVEIFTIIVEWRGNGDCLFITDTFKINL